MKVKKLIKKLSYYPLIGNTIYLIAKILKLTVYQERIIKLQTELKFFKSTGFGKIVLRGPFKGLTYPSLESTCSEIAPKILGSYEFELFKPLTEILQRRYETVMDVGCAEGYYAVGLALKLPLAQVYAYDINKQALNMCRKLAQTNHVENRVHLHGLCTSQTINNFKFGNRGLIVCDCEGYELSLFTSENIKNLKQCDLLIELHDILIPGLSNKLLPLFKHTHHIEIITTQARNSTQFPELKPFSDHDREIILSEFRDGLYGKGEMSWAYLTAFN